MSGSGSGNAPRWMTCPICQRQFLASESEALPFCSSRCRLVDLGRWLDERYGLPMPPEEASEEETDEP